MFEFRSRRTVLLAMAAMAVMDCRAGELTPGTTGISDRVKTLLATASRGRSWTTPRGVQRWPLMVGGEQRGTLWEDVDPRSLAAGDSWESGSGLRVELVHAGRVVGMMWLDGDR